MEENKDSKEVLNSKVSSNLNSELNKEDSNVTFVDQPKLTVHIKGYNHKSSDLSSWEYAFFALVLLFFFIFIFAAGCLVPAKFLWLYLLIISLFLLLILMHCENLSLST